VHQAGHEEGGQDARLLPGSRPDGVVHRRPEHGGRREVPPPAPQVAQRRREVRPDELRPHPHPHPHASERGAAGGRGAGEGELHGAPDVGAVQHRARVEVQQNLRGRQTEEEERGGGGGELERAGGKGVSLRRRRLRAGRPSSSRREGGGEDEMERGGGRVQRPAAGGEEAELERAEPREEQGGAAPEDGRRREGELRPPAGSSAARRGRPGPRREDTARAYRAAPDTARETMAMLSRTSTMLTSFPFLHGSEV
jgi:hypothetical protein